MARWWRAAWRALPVLVAAALASVATSLFGCVVIAGASMEPALSPGDVLIYRRGVQGVAERDVVVLARAVWQRPVVHRIVSRTAEGRFVTRGDANPIPDRETASPADVRGRGVAVVCAGRVLHGLAGWFRRARLALNRTP